MKNLYAGLAVIVLVSIGNATGAESEKPVVRSLAERLPSDAVSNVEIFQSNGFRIESSRNVELGAGLEPVDHRFYSVFITGDDVFKVAVEKGRPSSAGGGVGVFHRTTGAPMLSVADQSGDGRIDLLSYSVVGDDGQTIREIVDYDADGQANLRVHFDQGYAEIWHLDAWHRIENRNGERGIVVDGEFKPVANVDNRLQVE